MSRNVKNSYFGVILTDNNWNPVPYITDVLLDSDGLFYMPNKDVVLEEEDFVFFAQRSGAVNALVTSPSGHVQRFVLNLDEEGEEHFIAVEAPPAVTDTRDVEIGDEAAAMAVARISVAASSTKVEEPGKTASNETVLTEYLDSEIIRNSKIRPGDANAVTIQVSPNRYIMLPRSKYTAGLRKEDLGILITYQNLARDEPPDPTSGVRRVRALLGTRADLVSKEFSLGNG